MSDKSADKYEPTDPIAQAQRRRFAAHTKDLKARFSELDETIIRNLSEDIFKLHFLKFFTGEDNDNKNWKEKLNHWITIAGNQRNAVNLVDGKGKFIIRVPPIYGGNAFLPIVDRREDIRYAMHVSQTKGQISPTLAHNHIATELLARLEVMRARGNAQKDVDEWMALFKHYGKLPKSSTVGGAKAQETDDDFEF